MAGLSSTDRCGCPGPLWFRSSRCSGHCACEIFLRPPSSPGNRLAFSVGSSMGGKQLHERGSETTQTAHPFTGLPPAAPLERSPCRLRGRVGGALSPPSGNTTFLLRQHTQESVLLPWLRAWRRLDPPGRTDSASFLPPERRAVAATTRIRDGRHHLGSHGGLLPGAARPPSGSGLVSPPAWPAGCHVDRRTGSGLCSRRKPAASSCRARLWFGSGAAHGADRPAGPG